jgi:succinate dehydrogenase / fumarate reductase membrane anchor subunit
MSISEKTVATPASHYGSPRAATRDFIVQRVTGALGVVFAIFFIWLFVRLAGASAADMRSLLANPVVAIVMALLIISTALHMRIGMNEVIEDYVTEERANRLAVTANWVVCYIVAAATLLALAKIVFWG